MSKSISFVVSMVIANIVVFSTISKFLTVFHPGLYSLYTYTTYIFAFLLLFFQIKRYGLTVLNKKFITFLCIYCIYIYYYTFISPKIDVMDLAYTPHDILSFMLRTFMLFSIILSSETIVNYFDLRQFLIVTVALCLFVSFWYIRYISLDVLLAKDSEEFVSPMAMGYANAPIFTFSTLQFWKYKGLYNLKAYIYLSVALLSGYVIFAMAERGPIVFSFLALFVCFYYRKVKSTKALVYTFILLVFVYINLENIINSIGYLFPSTAERLSQAFVEGDTNGRISTESGYEGVYVLGIKEFLKNPIFGSYFRIYGYYIFEGSYPHNVFVELLMTMGIAGFIPFLYILWKTIKNSHVSLKNLYTPQKEIFLVFCLLSSVKLLVSGTIVFNVPFWVFLYIMSNINHKTIKKVLS